MTHRSESSADDKRQVRNKMPGQTSSTAAPLYIRLHQRFLPSSTGNAITITSFASSNDDARVPLATDFWLFFLPASVSLRDIPPGSSDAVFQWPPDPDAAVSSTAHNSYAVWREQLYEVVWSRHGTSTAQCSVWLSVMRQQRYRTTKLRRTLKWLKFATGRNMMQGDTARSSRLKK